MVQYITNKFRDFREKNPKLHDFLTKFVLLYGKNLCPANSRNMKTLNMYNNIDKLTYWIQYEKEYDHVENNYFKFFYMLKSDFETSIFRFLSMILKDFTFTLRKVRLAISLRKPLSRINMRIFTTAYFSSAKIFRFSPARCRYNVLNLVFLNYYPRFKLEALWIKRVPNIWEEVFDGKSFKLREISLTKRFHIFFSYHWRHSIRV